MFILHVAKIEDNPFNGVCVVVPKYLYYQDKIANVELVNLGAKDVEGIKTYHVNDKCSFVSIFNKLNNRPNIVVFHEVYYKQYISICKCLKRNKVPYIIVPHGSLRDEAQKKKHIKKVIGNAFFFGKIIKESSGLQMLSKYEYENTNFKKEKFICTNGVEMPAVRKKSFNKSGIRFVYIGRLEVVTKGLDLMLESVYRKKDLFLKNNAVLDIYGPDIKGRLTEVKGIISKYKLDNIVSTHPPVLEKDKERVLMESDVFIQTSRHEGMPMGILEALSYGMPCLITKGTNLTEELETYKAGWTADNSVDDISDKIIQVFNDIEILNVLSNNAVELVENLFSWENITPNTIRKYREIVEKNNNDIDYLCLKQI